MYEYKYNMIGHNAIDQIKNVLYTTQYKQMFDKGDKTMSNQERLVEVINLVDDECIIRDLLVVVSDFIYLRKTFSQSSEDILSVERQAV